MSIYPLSTTSSLDVKLDRAQSSSFDKWLQIQYLPSGFKAINDEELQDQTRKRWYKRICCKFDLTELGHIFSIAILLIGILSYCIFTIYLLSPCSPFYSKHSNKTNTTSRTMASTAATLRVVNSTESMLDRKMPVSLRSLSVQLQDFFLGTEQREKENATDNRSGCIILSAYAISNFCLAHLMIFHLLLYIFHIVELLADCRSAWFAVEIAYATVFVLTTFSLGVVLCIIPSVDISGVLIILGIVQFVCGMIFLLSRCIHCKSGRPPQDLSDDVDGDYFRRNLKNIFRPKSQVPKEPKSNYKKKFISTKFKQEGERSVRDMFKSKPGKVPKSQRTTTKKRRFSRSSNGSSYGSKTIKSVVKSGSRKSKSK